MKTRSKVPPTPPPVAQRGRKPFYGFDKIEPGGNMAFEYSKKALARINTAATYYRKKGVKLVVRTVTVASGKKAIAVYRVQS